jgi:hypothetical protein
MAVGNQKCMYRLAMNCEITLQDSLSRDSK